MFSWLFGVRREINKPVRWNFLPVAAGRGLPLDASDYVRRDYMEDVVNVGLSYPYGWHWRWEKEATSWVTLARWQAMQASWITLAEIQAINWDEPIENQVVIYKEGQVSTVQTWTEQWGDDFRRDHPDAPALTPGSHVTVDGVDYAVRTSRRRDYYADHYDGDWGALLEMMEVLVKHNPCLTPNDVRLVVWFN